MVSIKTAAIAVLIGMLAAGSAAYAASARAEQTARFIELKPYDHVTIGKSGIRCDVWSGSIDCAPRGGPTFAPVGTLITITNKNYVEVWRREKNAQVTVIFRRKF